VLVGDAARDRQSEATARRGCVETDEALEDPLAFGLWHSGAGIGDAQFDVVVAASEAEANLAVGRGGACVVEEVPQEPAEPVGVSVDRRLGFEVERDARRGRRVGSCAREVGERDRLASWSRFEAGESEQVVDEPLAAGLRTSRSSTSTCCAADLTMRAGRRARLRRAGLVWRRRAA
jgi:hypothetical protein